MASAELMFRPAGELAALVRSGEVSSQELVETSLARIGELNPRLNAFVDVDADGALATADAIGRDDPRPFAGVPIAIKNNAAVEGMRLTIGCSLMSEFRAPYDRSVVRRLRDAGFVIVGTTTLPEYGILPVSEARLFGPTRNPWDPERTPGGSSGGSAAAVASGMVPVAHGNDGGGSTRIPAACCGLVGLKPQRNRISMAPELGHSMLGIDGVLTRTVAETAALLDVMAGPELGDAAWPAPPPEPFAVQAARAPERLRIAVTTTPPIPDAEVDPLCAAAVPRAVALLERLGHSVEEVDVPWQREELRQVFGDYFGAMIGLSIGYSAFVGANRLPREADMEPMSWALWNNALKHSALDLLRIEVQLTAFARELITFLEPYDALLTPALAERPLPIGTLDTAAPRPMDTFTRSAYFTPFTPIFNASGQPAIAVPLYEGDDGLPLAVQLVARPEQEGLLLALAAQLEQAEPWAGRRPPGV